MAYSKKASRRYRRGYYRRGRKYGYSRRRKYYRRYKGSRKYRRFPRKTEVKMVTKSCAYYWDFTQLTNTYISSFATSFARIFVLPVAGDNPYSLRIQQGTGKNERVGVKIRPVKLRIVGSMCYANQSPIYGTFTNINTASYSEGNNRPATGDIAMNGREVPIAFQVRLIVYQVRGGNATFDPYDANYHPLALEPFAPAVQFTYSDGTGCLKASEIKKMITAYNISSSAPIDYPNYNTLINNLHAGKMPLRLGIGGLMKVLYQKTWTLQTGMKTSIPFRLVTKVPERIVYPDLASGQASNNPRNAIYCMWLVVPQAVEKLSGTLNLNWMAQLFYTDS